MYGMSQYAVQSVLIDLGEGECWGEDCMFSAEKIEARLDPLDGTLEFECPECKTTNRRDLPTDH